MKILKIKMILILLMGPWPAVYSQHNPHVHAVDENVDLSELEGRYQLHSYESHKKKKSFLPSPQLRDQLYKEAGLEDLMDMFDELDLDLIFKKVQKKKISFVLKDYPTLEYKKNELQKLKELIKETDFER